MYRQLMIGFALMGVSACQSMGTGQAAGATEPSASESSVLSERERKTMEAAREHFIAEHDLYGNGQVSLTEFIEFRTQRFVSGDTASDGVMNRDEYVNEYAVRLDARLEEERRRHIEQTEARFNALDRNDDGVITWDEFAHSGERIFSRLDPDNTGRIEAASDEPSRLRHRGSRLLSLPTTHHLSGFMALYDEDASGVVTRESFDRQRREQFERTDTRGEGELTWDDYLNEFLARVDRRMESVRRDQLERAAVRFDAVDLNGDGVIDLDEYITVGLRTFQRWDSQGLGVVSADDPLPEDPRRAARAVGVAMQNAGDS